MSHEPGRRASAQVVAAVLCEGCAEVMRKHTGDLLALVLAGLKDPDPQAQSP